MTITEQLTKMADLIDVVGLYQFVPWPAKQTPQFSVHTYTLGYPVCLIHAARVVTDEEPDDLLAWIRDELRIPYLAVYSDSSTKEEIVYLLRVMAARASAR